MFNYKQCPVCGESVFKEFLICKDHTVSKEDFAIVECSACKFKFTNPIPDIDKLGSYYKSEDYISHSNTKKGIISRLYHLVRNYTLNKKINLVSEYVSRGTILDYGCGTGMFLRVCKSSGWSAYGLEPDKDAAKIAAESGATVNNNKSELEKVIKNQQLDAITLWHVLEHVTDLEDTLAFFNAKLKQSGVLIIAVPNHKSYDAVYYGKYWAAYDVPRHLYHFDKETIKLLLSNHGFNLVAIKPMKFDSFYVSMLSEKYKTGSINYFRAFITGLKSNLKAGSIQNHSSLIYVFKKK